MVKKSWKIMGEKIGWFIVISIPVIFFQAVLFYYITKDLPETGNVFGLIYDNVYFVWGLTLIILMVIWFIIKTKFEIKEKRGRL